MGCVWLIQKCSGGMNEWAVLWIDESWPFGANDKKGAFALRGLMMKNYLFHSGDLVWFPCVHVCDHMHICVITLHLPCLWTPPLFVPFTIFFSFSLLFFSFLFNPLFLFSKLCALFLFVKASHATKFWLYGMRWPCFYLAWVRLLSCLSQETRSMFFLHAWMLYRVPSF